MYSASTYVHFVIALLCHLQKTFSWSKRDLHIVLLPVFINTMIPKWPHPVVTAHIKARVLVVPSSQADLSQIDVPVAVKRGNRMVTGSCDLHNKETKTTTTECQTYQTAYTFQTATQVQQRAMVL